MSDQPAGVVLRVFTHAFNEQNSRQQGGGTSLSPVTVPWWRYETAPGYLPLFGLAVDEGFSLIDLSGDRS
jgi:hypothetical protein